MRRNLPLVLSLFFLGLFLSNTVSAQYLSKGRKPLKHRFNAGIIVGPSLSQIDGDRYQGFDKRGIRAGLKGMAYLTKRLDITTALLYNQKGSLLQEKNGYYAKDVKKNLIHLNYMEVPLLLSFKSLKNKNFGYRYDVGFSYARLANSRIDKGRFWDVGNKEMDFDILEPRFQTNEINFVAGISYFINSQIGIGFHYTVQFNKLYKKPLAVAQRSFQGQPIARPVVRSEVSLLRNYQLGFYLTYHIF